MQILVHIINLVAMYKHAGELNDLFSHQSLYSLRSVITAALTVEVNQSMQHLF